MAEPIPKFVGEHPFGVINPEYVEQLEQFFRKYAVGDLTVPSCMGCGQPTQEFKIGHIELHSIGLCGRCTDAIRSQASGLKPGEKEISDALSFHGFPPSGEVGK